MQAKKYGLVLQNPLASADEKFRSLQHSSTELIRAVMGEIEISTAARLQAVNEENIERKKNRG